MFERAPLARRFTEVLAARILQPDWTRLLRLAVLNESDEHKILGPQIQGLVEEFVASEDSENQAAVRFDWEGNGDRRWAQAHSYDLLGTGAHPDAAVLSPFRCALEFDREGTGRSHFKHALLKAACHSLSGAYDATLLVYVLTSSEATPADYVEDASLFTQRLLGELRAKAVLPVIVPRTAHPPPSQP